jgi:regulator of sirC expression with transglutaminase-like and TPR domain
MSGALANTLAGAMSRRVISSSPMPGSVRDELSVLISAGDDADLAGGALLVARVGYPDLAPAPVLRQLDELAMLVRPLVPRSLPANARVERLMEFLFQDAGFHGNGDDYYDPRNSFLNDVLARRTGIPISLATVSIEVGRRVDVPLQGVGFPGHFLLRAMGDEGPIFLDPFHGGQSVTQEDLVGRLRTLAQQAKRQSPDFLTVPEEFLEPVTTPSMLARMLRNLVRIYVKRRDHAHALTAVDLLLVLTPDSADDLRLRGVLYEALDCPAAAAIDLRRYAEIAQDADDAKRMLERAARLADDAPTIH